MLLPLVRELRDPVGSMGNDSALACLSDKPRMLYDYFKQLFAQVTNPAIDSIREEVIMSLECYIGPERKPARNDPRACPPAARAASDPVERAAGRAQAHEPSRLADARRSTSPGRAAKGTAGLTQALDRICREAEQAIDDGYSPGRAVGPRGRPRPRAAQLAAGRAAPCIIIWSARRSGRGSASCRNGRSPRGASPLPAGRLRRRRDQSRTWRSRRCWQARTRRRLARPAGRTTDDEDRRTRIARASPRACSR